MRRRWVVLFLLGFLLTLITSTAQAEIPLGSQIAIDASLNNDLDTAVAYSSNHNQYLVVYVKEIKIGDVTAHSDIYGRFVDAKTLTALGSPFPIANETADETDAHEVSPDVAYDPHNDRFVVVYQHSDTINSTNINVKARVVYGSYQTSGSQIPSGANYNIVESISYSYSDPAIAYNADEHQFMTVYMKENRKIHGLIIFVNPTGNNLLVGPSGNLFEVWQDSVNLYYPDIAWGGSSNNNFLVVWQKNVSTSVRKIYGRYMYDTDQYPSDQGVNSSAYELSAVTTSGNDYHRFPAAAFDLSGGHYGVVYQSDNIASGTPRYEVAGVMLAGSPGSGSPIVSSSRTVIQPLDELFGDTHGYPDISYSGLAGIFQVSYISEYSLINAYSDVFMRQFYYTGSSGAATPRTLVSPITPDKQRFVSSIASTSNGHCLVAWQYMFSATDNDIYARLLAPYEVFSPVVFK